MVLILTALIYHGPPHLNETPDSCSAYTIGSYCFRNAERVYPSRSYETSTRCFCKQGKIKRSRSYEDHALSAVSLPVQKIRSFNKVDSN